MKKLLNISSVGRIIVFLEIIMCAVWSLSVLMVNGTDAISNDHISLFLLLTLTIASVLLVKSRKPFLNKAVLWIAILPLLFISYETAATFLMPYDVQSVQPANANQIMFILNPVR